MEYGEVAFIHHKNGTITVTGNVAGAPDEYLGVIDPAEVDGVERDDLLQAAITFIDDSGNIWSTAKVFTDVDLAKKYVADYVMTAVGEEPEEEE